MKDKLVSIIVLTYRNFDNIEKNLKSIFYQNYSNIEIIVSDDGSDNFDVEKIEKILENKLQNIKNIQVIHHEKNIGTVKNFNEAIKKATGEYIFPLSQDDCFYSENTIEEIVNNFGGFLVVTSIREVYSEDKLVGELPLKIDRERFDQSNLYEFLIFNGNIISGASTYYKKEVFEKYGYFDEEIRLLEDMPFYLRILSKNEKIKFIAIKTIKYSLGGVSTLKKPSLMLIKDWIKMYEKEVEGKRGYLKRYIQFLLEIQKNISKDKSTKIVYLQFPDILIFKIINKIFKVNILFKLYGIK
ncbi:MAG: glycosyltransferase family 2 protein [Cetobacterium sp.]|uniref:glycosyltransferase family 2 protein n=1 Tax=Cetobacterium sp. TaxID=2071632 RepID=UPI003F3B7B29